MPMILPEKIENCPIIDAIVEIRFETNIYPHAVFGVLFHALKHRFPNVENLPILQLPEQLREMDPKLKYSPHYKATDGAYQVQIGPRVFTLSSPVPYAGWRAFSEVLHSCYATLFSLNVIEKVTRLGIRYINFFDLDIFDKINLQVTLNNELHIPINTHLRTQLAAGDFLVNLHISNSAKFENRSGSILDLDTYKEYDEEMDFKDHMGSELDKGHEIEKKAFFSLLNAAFLHSLHPVYSKP